MPNVFVGVVGSFAKLELVEDATARASGRFIDDLELRHRWSGPGRVFSSFKRARSRKRSATTPPRSPPGSKKSATARANHTTWSNPPRKCRSLPIRHFIID